MHKNSKNTTSQLGRSWRWPRPGYPINVDPSLRMTCHGEMKTTLDFTKLLIRKTISVDRIDACGELIRREAHTRFGAFLSTGLNVRPAPLTEGGFLHRCSSILIKNNRSLNFEENHYGHILFCAVLLT